LWPTALAGVRTPSQDMSQQARSDSAIIAHGHVLQEEAVAAEARAEASPMFQRKFFWNKGIVQPADKASEADKLARRHSAGTVQLLSPPCDECVAAAARLSQW
jgi:hypothetical protein